MTRRMAAWGVMVALLALPVTAAAGAVADDPAFEQMLSYKMGGDAGPLKRVEELVVQSHGKPLERAAIEARLAGALRLKKATTDCKRFVCRMLVNAGTARSVPILASLLEDKELSHMALYALARIDDPAATKALQAALGKLEGEPLVEVINAVGDRQDAAAVDELTKLAKREDAAVAEAAIAALGKIGGERANAFLQAQDLAAAEPRRRALLIRARLRCADRLVDLGKKDVARATYEQLYKPDQPIHVRAAALRGLLATAPESSVDTLLAALRAEDEALRRVAIGLAREFDSPEAVRTFAAQLPKLPEDTQVLLLGALADSGQPVASDAVVQAAKSRHPSVRIAALRALADLGDASSVSLLAEAITADKKEVADAARWSLNRLSGDGVDAAILAAMKTAKPERKVELIQILASRRVDEAVPALLEGAASGHKEVARQSFNALRTLASEGALAAMVELLLDAEDGAARGAAERAIITIAGKVKDESARLEPVLAALPKAEPRAKAALLRIAGKFGGQAALKAVRDGLDDKSPGVREAALKTLADWPDASPRDDLLRIVKSSEGKTQILAFRGYIRLLTLPSDEPASAILDKLAEAMKLAPSVAEQKRVLSAVADVRHPAALEMLQPYLDDPQLEAEARAAADKIKKALQAPARVTASVNAGKASNAIDGKPDTRWDTGRAMSGGEWFLYELPVEHKIEGLTLDTRGSRGDYPRGYEVYVSRDGKNWGKPVAQGKGTKPVTKISFEPTYGRFIKIVQTGKTSRLFWSIHEITVDSELGAAQ
ncbi:MAG: HEAT repeat domain-containing protein [Planctomycetota bacterium]